MQDFLVNNYSIWKSLHIIFVISWFAGLFYIVRLFIYHSEAETKSEVEKTILQQQFRIMEKRLWQIITTPAMILTVVFGTCMLIANSSLLSQPWMHVKLTFVVLLLVYHFICGRMIRQLKTSSLKWNSGHLRLWNELATLFMVAIVFLAIQKSTLSWIGGVVVFFSIGISLMIAVKLYKRFRKNS